MSDWIGKCRQSKTSLYAACAAKKGFWGYSLPTTAVFRSKDFLSFGDRDLPVFVYSFNGSTFWVCLDCHNLAQQYSLFEKLKQGKMNS